MKLPDFISKKLIFIGVAALTLITIIAVGSYFLVKKNPEATVVSESTTQAMSEKSSAQEEVIETKEKHNEPPQSQAPSQPSQSEEISDNKDHTHLAQAAELSDVLLPKRDFLTLIVCDLGLNEELTDLAITELPAEVVLAFTPYAKLLNRWFHPAKQAGHQLLIQLHNEQDLSEFNIVSYYDGVLMMPQMPPADDKKILEDFLNDAKNKRLLILDHRLLFHNSLRKHAQQKNTPIIQTDYSLSMSVIMGGEIDILSLNGILVVDVKLVPYLIELLQKHPQVKLKKLEQK